MRGLGISLVLVFLLTAVGFLGCSKTPSEAAEFYKHHDLANKYFEQAKSLVRSDPRQAHKLYSSAYREAKDAVESAPKNMPKAVWIKYQNMLGLANDCLDQQEKLQRQL